MNAPSPEIRTGGATDEQRAGPPQLPFVLSVGVTGHRADSLPKGSAERLESQIHEVLMLIADAGEALLRKEQDCFARVPLQLRFVSPIADGADQIAAEVALSSAGSFRRCCLSPARTIARASPTMVRASGSML